MTKPIQRSSKGFTLIELLVVIAIIGLLSTLAVIALGNARQKARDSKRQSDLKTLQTAIELYSNETGAPPAVPTVAWSELATTLAEKLPGGLPEDPQGLTWCYCKDATAGSTKYLIAAPIEQNEDISGDIDADSATILTTYTNLATTDCMCSNNADPTALDCTDNGGGDINGTAYTVMCLGAV